jgi:hypothetical protein
VAWNNNRQTTNGIYDYFSRFLNSYLEVIANQPVAGRLRPWAEPALPAHCPTNQKVSDIAFARS